MFGFECVECVLICVIHGGSGEVVGVGIGDGGPWTLLDSPPAVVLSVLGLDRSDT